MEEDNLHPTVREFRNFINEHPKLIEEVRRNGRHWQEYYEKWSLLGEEDPMWDQYKGEEDTVQAKQSSAKDKKPEILGQLMKLTENMDINKIQGQVEQLSNTISTVQELLGTFQGNKKTLPTPKSQPGPFNWFRD